MIPPPARGVFISYRRSDAGPYARLLQIRFGQRLRGAPVFMDLDSIEAGDDFAEAIQAAVESCRVLIALIGPRWLTVSDAEGRPRLDDPDDYVRFEIRTALERRARSSRSSSTARPCPTGSSCQTTSPGSPDSTLCQ